MPRSGLRIAAASLSFLTVTSLVGLDALAATEVCDGHVGDFSVHYSCLTEDLVTHDFHPFYDNGFQGGAGVSANRPWQTWPTIWNRTGDTIPEGVSLSGFQETSIRMIGAGNLTANESTRPWYTAPEGQRLQGAPSIPLIAFGVHLNASKVMSGSSEFYYRSPLIWQEGRYAAHYLNVFDDTGRVVIADRYDPLHEIGNVTNAELDHGRLYYHLVAKLQSGVTYRFVEFVNQTQANWGLGLDHVDTFVAGHQDVDDDGTLGGIVFPGTTAQHDFSGEFDFAYSFRFIFGIGPGGTMNLIRPLEGTDSVILKTTSFAPRNQSILNNRFDLYVPLRLTQPVTVRVVLSGCINETVYERGHNTEICGSQPGGPNNIWEHVEFTRTIENLTGSIIEHFECDCPEALDPTQAHVWYVTLTFDMLPDPNGDITKEPVITYPMFQEDAPNGQPGIHVVSWHNASLTRTVQPIEWAMWAEVYEAHEDIPQPIATQSQSTHASGFITCQGYGILGIPKFYECIGILVLTVAAVILAPEVAIPLLALGVYTGYKAIIAWCGEGTLPSLQFNNPVGHQDNPRPLITGNAGGKCGNGPARQQVSEWNARTWEAIKSAALVTLCAGALVAPVLGGGIGAATGGVKGATIGTTIGKAVQPIAAVGCGLLAAGQAGILDDLLDFFVQIPEIIKKAVDYVGQLLSQLLQIAAALWTAFGPWIYFFLYSMTALTVVLVFREAMLTIFAWLIVLFMALNSEPAVTTLRRGEAFARMLPIPMWDNWMKRRGAIRGTYYRDERMNREGRSP